MQGMISCTTVLRSLLDHTPKRCFGHSRPFLEPNVSALISPLSYRKHETDLVVCLSAYMRFKGYDCAYTDDYTWAIYEEFARTNHGSIGNYNTKYMTNFVKGITRFITKKCDFRISQWSYFEITFGLELALPWPFGKQRLWSKGLHFIDK